jgi:hypothetical protein
VLEVLFIWASVDISAETFIRSENMWGNDEVRVLFWWAKCSKLLPANLSQQCSWRSSVTVGSSFWSLGCGISVTHVSFHPSFFCFFFFFGLFSEWMNGLFCSSYEKIRKAMGFNDWVILFIIYWIKKLYIYISSNKF